MSDSDGSSKRNIHLFGKSVSNWATFSLVSLVFVFVSTLETTLVKDYNFQFSLIWPCYTAFLLSCGWPIQAIPLLFKEKLSLDSKVSFFPHKTLLIRYIILGAIDGAHIVCMSFGLNYLPGSTYVLLKSTSICFNVALSRLSKKQLITKWHFIAVGVVMIAPAFLAAGGSQDRQDDVTLGEYIAGFILVFVSAFFLGSHYVLSDRLLKKETVGKVGQNYASAEIALYSGLFTFIFVIIFILIDWGGITHEASDWFSTFHTLKERGDSGKLAGISLGVALCHQLAYLLKYWLVAKVSSLLADMLNSISRIIVAVVTYLLFSEYFGWQKGVAIVFVVIGFLIYIYAGTITKRIKTHDTLEMMTTTEEQTPIEDEKHPRTWSTANVSNKENS